MRFAKARGLEPLSLVAIGAAAFIGAAITVRLTQPISRDTLDSLIAFVSLTALSCGTYVIWPSRWNIPAHLGLGFALTAYGPAIFGVHVFGYFSATLVHSYVRMVGLGAVAYLVGLVIGARLLRFGGRSGRASYRSSSERLLAQALSRRTFVLLMFGLVGMIVSFYVMGFVPMFASDPLAAKFFRGRYQAPYASVALLFRTSFQILATIIPVGLVLWYVTRQLTFLVLSGAAVIAIMATLTRSPALIGVLLFLGLVLVRRRGGLLLYLGLLLFVYPLGSIAYYLLGHLLNIPQFQVNITGVSLWRLIGSGAPDVPSQLSFLDVFSKIGHFTHGRTFWGGLIPWHYAWNPSVFTLTFGQSGADVGSITSGGVRLPAPMWGYTAFGWAGAVWVPFVSGVILGTATSWVRRHVGAHSLLRSVVALTLYTTLATQLSMFYVLSIYSVPGIFVACVLAFPVTAAVRRGRVRTPGPSPGPRRLPYPVPT